VSACGFGLHARAELQRDLECDEKSRPDGRGYVACAAAHPDVQVYHCEGDKKVSKDPVTCIDPEALAFRECTRRQ
jgi:hypothetical protein